jgi:hypothetical protein
MNETGMSIIIRLKKKPITQLYEQHCTVTIDFGIPIELGMPIKMCVK